MALFFSQARRTWTRAYQLAGMQRTAPFIALLGLGLSCTAPPGPPDPAADIDRAVRAVMQAQEQAWDQGDVDGFMRGYAPDICFVGASGTTCGRDSVTARYKRRYPDRAAMGDLTFGDLEVLPAGAEHAWCTGTWRLIRATDTLGGGFSLFWERKDGAWRILRDHTY
jgi:ketosteroid isomerase-like protein